MTVQELIDLLSRFPPETPVGHINRCADDGTDFVAIDSAEITGYGRYGGKAFAPDNMPAKCLLLS
jgi:hypothetical protein